MEEKRTSRIVRIRPFASSGSTTLIASWKRFEGGLPSQDAALDGLSGAQDRRVRWYVIGVIGLHNNFRWRVSSRLSVQSSSFSTVACAEPS